MEERCLKNKYKIEKVIFWGCGTVGKEMLNFWHKRGREPYFFCDNNPSLWNKSFYNIEVISPDRLLSVKPERIILSLVKWQGVKRQLLELGISEKNIITPDFLLNPIILNSQAEYLYSEEKVCMNHEQKIFIDLSCGMVLGGVERWSYNLAVVLKELGYSGRYIFPSKSEKYVFDNIFPILEIGTNKEDKINVFESAINVFKEEENAVVICNFPFEIFEAACVVKRCINNNLKIISLIHNDENIYFEVYEVWKKEIDYCLVISKKIYMKLLCNGFPKEKIVMLTWNMVFPNRNRGYSLPNEPLRLGYAGRITIYQKRVDKLLEIASRLKEKQVNFMMTIAGSGDYEEKLKEEIKKNNLGKNICYLGLLPHEQIFSFWDSQDIFISCSEFEGHSISQLEAMGMGTVPILTNTSGVEEDVKDGINGYIVDIDDIESMIERIELLCKDRKRLQEMGEQACKDIRNKSSIENERKFWIKLFERIGF